MLDSIKSPVEKKRFVNSRNEDRKSAMWVMELRYFAYLNKTGNIYRCSFYMNRIRNFVDLLLDIGSDVDEEFKNVLATIEQPYYRDDGN